MTPISGGLLCLLLCCWYVDETLGTNPGLKIRLSQSGLDYAARVAVQQLSSKVQGTSLPDQSGKAHTPVGKVEYEVKNMRVGISLRLWYSHRTGIWYCLYNIGQRCIYHFIFIMD